MLCINLFTLNTLKIFDMLLNAPDMFTPTRKAKLRSRVKEITFAFNQQKLTADFEQKYYNMKIYSEMILKN